MDLEIDCLRPMSRFALAKCFAKKSVLFFFAENATKKESSQHFLLSFVFL